MTEVIETRGLKKDFARGDLRVHALNGISVSIAPGEFVAIVGKSGSGKSTFMNILGCLDRPSEGSYFLDGETLRGSLPTSEPNCEATKSVSFSRPST